MLIVGAHERHEAPRSPVMPQINQIDRIGAQPSARPEIGPRHPFQERRDSLGVFLPNRARRTG